MGATRETRFRIGPIGSEQGGNEMLRELAERLKRYLSLGAPPSAEQAEATAKGVRQGRADHVVHLRQEIRRLQQEITDTNGETASEHLASLYKELEQKQAELARYQGRV
jgi:TolA-binding protein